MTLKTSFESSWINITDEIYAIFAYKWPVIWVWGEENEKKNLFEKYKSKEPENILSQPL